MTDSTVEKTVAKADSKRSWTKCFLIQPFGKKPGPQGIPVVDNDKVLEALGKLRNIRPTTPIDIFNAAQRPKRSDVHGSVVECIAEADFCIADLTGLNMNVLYETGIATGLGKPVIFITQERKDLPTDLKGKMITKYAFDDLVHLADDIDLHLDRVFIDIETNREKRLQVVKYFSQRDDAQIRDKIRTSSTKIDILQTNLAIVQGRYITEIQDAMRRHEKLVMRILTLDPQSVFVNYRGQQLGYKDNIALYRGELEANLRGVHFQLREFESNNRVQIRIYDDFPTQIAFIFPSEVLACVVSATARSRENCAFLLPLDMPGVENSFIQHFEYLWDERNGKSKPYQVT